MNIASPWRDGAQDAVPYEPFDPNCDEQREFINSEDEYIAYIGGRGSGKTAAGAVKLLRYLQKHPGARALVTAPVYEQLAQGAIPQIERWAPPGVVLKSTRSPYYRMQIKGGSVIEFRSAQEPDNLRAGNYAYFWGDEAAGFSEYAFQVANATVRQPGFPPVRVFTSTPQWQNWLYRMFVLTKDPKYKLFSGIATAVNLGNLPDSFIDDLSRQYGGLDNPFAQQELLGLFVAQTGQVYSLFNRKHHLRVPSRSTQWRLTLAGVDWGGRAPFALVVVGIDQDYRLWVIDEFYRAGITINEFARACKLMAQKYPINRFCCDGTAPAAAAVLQKENLRTWLPTRRGHDWLKQGVMRISGLFEKREDDSYSIYVHPKCESFIREIEGYHWPDKKEGQADPKDPVKENDHALDAFRYVTEYIAEMRLGQESTLGRSTPFTVRMGKKEPPFFMEDGKKKIKFIKEVLANNEKVAL